MGSLETPEAVRVSLSSPRDPPPTNSPAGSSPGCRSILPTFHKGRFPSRCLAESLMHLLLCASLVTATAPIPQDTHSGTNIYYWFHNFKPIVAENPVVALGWVVGFARRVRWGHTGFRRRRRRAVSCHRWQGLSCVCGPVRSSSGYDTISGRCGWEAQVQWWIRIWLTA